ILDLKPRSAGLKFGSTIKGLMSVPYWKQTLVKDCGYNIEPSLNHLLTDASSENRHSLKDTKVITEKRIQLAS
ncbi:hypothetical protein, partial [uncultured Duncaniella sp.]